MLVLFIFLRSPKVDRIVLGGHIDNLHSILLYLRLRDDNDLHIWTNYLTS
jgi:hypothetical protein